MPRAPLAVADLADLADLVGIPPLDRGRTRAGCDCWGCVCIAYAEKLGIALPWHYTHSCADPARAAVIAEGAAAPEWRVVPEAEAWPLDVIVLRMGGDPVHVGLRHSPGRMLHGDCRVATCLARLDHPRWRSLSRKYYRHRDRC